MGIERYGAEYLGRLQQVLEAISHDDIARVADALRTARDTGRRIYIFGNGGSAVTASHFAVDLGKGTAVEGTPRFRAVALTDNMAAVTAIGNDYAYDRIFEEQLQEMVEPGDVAIAISASGNSPNVIRAVEYARGQGAVTVGLCGFGGGKLAGLVDHALSTPAGNYGLSEDFHLILIHILTQYLKFEMAGIPDERVPF